MTIAQKINMALAYKGISKAELARSLGTTPQNLGKKIQRNSLTKEELEQIAEILGADFRLEFVFPDGTVI